MGRIRALEQRLHLYLREKSHFSLLKLFAFFYWLGNAIVAAGWAMIAFAVRRALALGVALEPVEDRNARTVLDRFDREG